MRLSCNGCRVLRKGCADACTIRPCLQWIKDPAAQSNATVFLAKFYGRAGLINLIDAGRDDAVRPAIFRSLLYEACGRVVNPVYGSVGLLWSGNWALCQAAVEAVLRGEPIVQISDEAAAASPAHLIYKAGFDIRHVAKHASSDAAGDGQKKVASKQAPGADDDSEKKKAGRTSLKRTSASATSGTRSKKPKQHQPPSPPEDDDRRRQSDGERAPSHASSTSHQQQREESVDDTDAEASGSHVSQAEQQHSRAVQLLDDEEEPEQQHQLCLDLTLGFAPLPAAAAPCVPPPAVEDGCGLTSCWKEPGGLAFRFL